MTAIASARSARLGLRATVAQIAWLLAGIGLVTLVSGMAHSH